MSRFLKSLSHDSIEAQKRKFTGHKSHEMWNIMSVTKRKEKTMQRWELIMLLSWLLLKIPETYPTKQNVNLGSDISMDMLIKSEHRKS